MAKIAVIFLVCLSLRCAWSFYAYNSPQSYQPRVIYRHHIAPYQPQATFVQPIQIPYAPTHFGPPPMMSFHASHSTPMSYFAPPRAPMYPPMSYAPAASYQSSYFSRPPPPPPRSPRFPIKEMFTGPLQTAFSQYPSKPSIFNKIKPFIFGNQGPRSLPHHPFYPDYFPPHQFVPNKPFHNRPSHHGFNSIQHSHQSHAMMTPEKSCSCSLHVRELTVYKHTDVRSSYSCEDLKDCNDFCTNLFSSEDLRAQTRSDACLILGKDTSVPWFRRDHVCEPNGVKNDTKLSVDLCCKNLQPC